MREKLLKFRPCSNLLALAAVWVSFLSVFIPEWRINEQYGYGLFVPLLMLYLIWLRSEDRPAPVQKPSLLWVIAGLLCVLPFPALHVILGANPEWRMALWAYALCTVAATVFWVGAWGGWPWVRHYTAVFVLILLAVPWPTAIEGPMVQGMMRVVAQITVEVMNLLGFYAQPHGNLIELSSGFVGVEEACSGVRSFQSTLMAAYFFGVLFRWGYFYRFLLILAGCAVSLLLNLIRTFTLAMVMANRGTEAMAVLHDPVGHMVSFGSFVVLFLLTWLVHRLVMQAGPIRKTYWAQGHRRPKCFSMTVASLVIVYMVFTHALTWYWYARTGPDTSERLLSSMDWEAIRYSTRVEEIPPTVRNILRYTDGKQITWTDPMQTTWTAFFFHWEPGAVSSHVTVHRPEVCLPSAGFRLVDTGSDMKLDLDGIQVGFNSYVFAVANRSYYVYFAVWDSVPGHSIPLGSGWRERLEHAWNGRRIDGRYSLQIVLTGPQLNEQRARRQVEAFLDQTLRVRPAK